MLVSIIGLIVLCLVINYFADKLGNNLDKLAMKFRISSGVRGATFEAVSSSVPELMTGLMASIAFIGILGEPDLNAFSEVGVGTIGGSAIFNILVIPLLSILVVPSKIIDNIEVDKKSMLVDMLFYLSAVGMLFLGSYLGNINPIIGGIMTGMYILYVYYLFGKDKKRNIKEDFEEVTESTKKMVITSLLYLIPIGISVHYSITFAEIIGTTLNIPRMIMSLIVLAGITSIPDALLSIKSAKNGELDASIANAVGSNSFDILICLGFVVMISNIQVGIVLSEVIDIFYFLILSSVMYTLTFYFKSKKIVKIILLSLPYSLFVVYLCLKIKG